jgi:hypothetical protein
MKKELSASQKVKRDLTKKFPNLKFSVRGGWATHTPKIEVSIIEIKNSFINPVLDYEHSAKFINVTEDKQVSGLTSFGLLEKGYDHANYHYIGKTKEVVTQIFKIIEEHYGTFERGDSMIDTLNNYFYDIDFGKWDKPLIYNSINIQEVFKDLEYIDATEYPYYRVITTGTPKEYKSFDELKKLHLEYLLSLLPKVEVKTVPQVSTTNTDKFLKEVWEAASIEDYTHTQSQEQLKVLKLSHKLSRDQFVLFRAYMTKNCLGYYSRYAKGFILENKQTPKPISSCA